MMRRLITAVALLALLTGAVSAALTRVDGRGLSQKLHQALGGKEAVSSWDEAYNLLRGLKYAPASLGQKGVDAGDVERLMARFGRNTREDAWVRAMCLYLLGDVGSARSQEILAAALQDRSEDVRRAAAVSLAKLGDYRAAEPLLSVLAAKTDEGLAEALMAIDDPRASKYFVKGLQNKSPAARAVSALWLGASQDYGAVQPLLDALRKEQDRPSQPWKMWESDIQATGGRPYTGMHPAEAEAAALAEINDPASIKALTEIASRNGSEVSRRGAIVALAQVGGVEALQPLASLLHSSATEIRKTAALVLGSLTGPEARNVLQTALGDKDLVVRLYAVLSLISLGYPPPDAAAVAAKKLADPRASEELRVTAARVLGAARETSAVEPLVNILKNPAAPPGLQQAVITALGDLETPRAAMPLQSFLEGQKHSLEQKSRALSSLQKIDPSAAERFLLELLPKSKDPQFWQAAMLALADADGPAAVRSLLKGLRDSQSPVRYAALNSLAGKADQPEVRRALANLVQRDRDPFIRSQAAFGLEGIDDTGAKGALQAALKDPSPQVRRAAIASLTPLADADAMQNIRLLLADSNLGVRQAAILSLGLRAKDFPQHIDLLTPGLSDANWRVRQAAMMGLGAIAGEFPQLQQPLLDAFNDKSQPLAFRQNAMLALAKIDQPEVKRVLLNNLKSPDWRIRQTAVLGLGNFAEPAMIASLQPLIRDGNWQVRQATAVSLAGFDIPQAAEKLHPLLGDPRWQVRQSAAVSLGRWDSQTATQSLLGGLRDSSPQVRYAVLGSLAGRAGQPGVGQAMANLVTRDSDPLIRGRAALGLEGISDPAAKFALQTALKDPFPQVRRAAIASLTPMADVDAMQRIRPLLADSDLGVRQAAILSLGLRAKDFPQHIDLLSLGLSDASWRVRQATITGLGANVNEFPQLKQPLLDVFNDRSQPLAFRQNAMLALSTINQPEIRTVLVNNLKHPDWRMRQTAVLGLGNFKEIETISSLQPLTRDSNWQVRQASALSLANFDSPLAAQGLRPLLSDPHWQVRQSAIASFGRFELALKTDSSDSLLNDKNFYVRQTAAQVLKTGSIIKPNPAAFWASSSQMIVDRTVSAMQRQLDHQAVSQLTEKLFLRDAAYGASYGLSIASLAAPGGFALAGPGFYKSVGAVSLAFDAMGSFGPEYNRKTFESASTGLTLVSLKPDIISFITDPPKGFTGVMSALGAWKFHEIGDRFRESISRPMQFSGSGPLRYNDGFTSISGSFNTSLTYIAPAGSSKPFHVPSTFEGTWVRKTQSNWTTITGPNLNLAPSSRPGLSNPPFPQTWIQQPSIPQRPWLQSPSIQMPSFQAPSIRMPSIQR